MVASCRVPELAPPKWADDLYIVYIGVGFIGILFALGSHLGG